MFKMYQGKKEVSPTMVSLVATTVRLALCHIVYVDDDATSDSPSTLRVANWLPYTWPQVLGRQLLRHLY